MLEVASTSTKFIRIPQLQFTNIKIPFALDISEWLFLFPSNKLPELDICLINNTHDQCSQNNKQQNMHDESKNLQHSFIISIVNICFILLIHILWPMTLSKDTIDPFSYCLEYPFFLLGCSPTDHLESMVKVDSFVLHCWKPNYQI